MSRIKDVESKQESQRIHGYGKMAENRKITAEAAAVVGDKEENETSVLNTQQLFISMTDTVRARTGVAKRVLVPFCQ